MKYTHFVLTVIFLIAISTFSFGQTSEKDLVRVPLENYIKGHATGDGEYMKKAFHTEGNLVFIREGKFTTRSFADYIAGFTGNLRRMRPSVSVRSRLST